MIQGGSTTSKSNSGNRQVCNITCSRGAGLAFPSPKGKAGGTTTQEAGLVIDSYILQSQAGPEQIFLTLIFLTLNPSIVILDRNGATTDQKKVHRPPQERSTYITVARSRFHVTKTAEAGHLAIGPNHSHPLAMTLGVFYSSSRP
jgi:hypothetical protein